MRSLAASGSIALVLAFTTVTGLAAAQGAPPAAAPEGDRADVLFEEGRALMASGDHAAACARFEESQALRPGIGTLFNLADCHEKTGRLVLAYREFAEVVQRTEVALQADREKIARERLAALEARVPRVVVAVPEDGKGTTVLLDGQPLEASAWNVPQPLEPGEHVVTARVPDRKVPFTQTFTVAAGDAPVTITIGDDDAPASGGKRNTGLIVTGSILMGVGLVGAAIGSWQIENGRDGAGIATGLGGLACIGVGVPLFIIGLKKRPASGTADGAGDGDADAQTAGELDVLVPGPIPAIGIGPGTASASWRF